MHLTMPCFWRAMALLRVYAQRPVCALVLCFSFAVQSHWNVSSAQALECPAGFDFVSEAETTFTCLFEATLQGPLDGEESPVDSTEGATLIADARAVCRSANGTPRSARSIGTTGVAMDCVIEKPAQEPTQEPTQEPDPAAAPPPPPPPPPAPEIIDFDLGSQFQPGTTEASVATSLARTCNGLLEQDSLTLMQEDLLERCRDINREDDGGLQFQAVENVAAKQYADLANLVNFQNTIMVGEIGNRLASLREIMSQTVRDVASNDYHPAPGLFSNRDSQRGGAAGDDDVNSIFSRLGAFVVGTQGDGDKQTTSLSRGFDYTSSTATIGVDYLVNNSTIVGFALGHGSSSSDLFGGVGEINIRNNNLSVYGSKYFKEGWYLDAIAGIGEVDSRNRRSIDFTVNNVTVEQEARGQFDSSQVILSFGGGRSFEAWANIDVTARVNYIDTAIDRFAESTNPGEAGFGLGLEIDSYDVSSTTSDVSVAFSKPLSQRWGVLVPSATFRWLHEFEEGEDVLFGRFLADPSSFDFSNSGVVVAGVDNDATIFTVPLEKVDANYGNVRVGVAALFANQLSANLSVSRTVGLNDFDHTYFSLTLRRDFN